MIRVQVLAGAAVGALALASGASPAAAQAALNTALPAPTVARSPFTSVTVFGDSLSDDGDLALATGLPKLTGTGAYQKFTTNPANVAVEAVAAGLGLPLAPSLIGGSDYAFGGAGVTTNSPGTPATVPTETAQIAGYLATHKTLDPTGLYTVLGGANDIFYHGAAALAGVGAAQAIAALPAALPAATRAALAAQINAGAAAQVGVASIETVDQAGAAVTAAAAQEVTLIGQLKAAGAKYVVVFNLPDIGGTPQAQATDRAAPGAAAAFTQLTNAYNQVLTGGLTQIGTGIVPVNLNLFNAETKANPAAFGLTNVTTPACTSASSLTCTPATLVAPNAASTYLFADGVHPTGAAHFAIGQYVLAELAAPAYVSLLGEAPLGFSLAQRRRLMDEMAIDGTDPTSGARAFASFDYQSQRFDGQAYTSDLHSDGGSATVGFDWRASPSLTAGAALTYGDTFSRFGDQAGKFRTQELLGTVFGQYQYRGAGYVNATAGFGGIDFRDIQRSFALGVGRRTERADASGTDITANLTAGWWFGFDSLYQSLKVSPYVSARYERVRVDGFSEDGSDSTAMTFGEQTREAMVGEFGARAQATVRAGFATLSPYVQVAYDYDGDAHQRSITAGLVTLPGTFDMPGYTPADSWGSVEAGVNARLNDKVSLFASYNGRFSDDSQSYDAANVGVKYVF